MKTEPEDQIVSHTAKRKQILPDNRSYADTNAFGEKILSVGDSNLKKIKRNKLIPFRTQNIHFTT